MLAILLSALFVSCKDEMDELESRPSRWDALGINFNAEKEGFEKPTTRAGEKEEFFENEMVSVLAMKSENNSTPWSKVFANDTVVITNVGAALWSYENKVKWENYFYKFRAFFPYAASAFNTAEGESCVNGFEWRDYEDGETGLVLNNYTSADDPRKNTDLMVSQLVSRNNNTDVVSLDMKHLLANVSFNFVSKADKKLTITNFSVVGYASVGRCSITDNINWSDATNSDGTNREVDLWITYNPTTNVIDYEKSKYVVKSSSTGKQMTLSEIQTNLLYNSYPNQCVLYMASSMAAGNEGSDKFNGYLFIPQELKKDDEKVNITVHYRGRNNDWIGDWTDNRTENVTLKRDLYGDIEFYFGDNDPGVGNRLHATIDLTAAKDGNPTIESWDAGKKYTYTVGMYEHQVNVNIDVAPWDTHTLDGGDLR